MQIKISDTFTYKKLISYVLPCIAMMIMTSIYSIVDGYFVSNMIGKNPFAAVNLIMPVLMGISVLAGITNMLLDYLFMGPLKLGIAGAAIATMTGQIIGSIVPLVYFIRNKNGLLKLGFAKFDRKCIVKACGNGSSEMLTNLSTSIVSVVYNFQLMKIAKENGIAAYGVIMYVSFIFMAIFFGYAVGINPVIGYNYGAGNKAQLHSLLKKSLTITAITAVAMTLSSELLALPIAKIFVGYDETLCHMTQTGMMLYSISFLFCGFNIFASSFFTGLNNGVVSAAISFLRTFVIQLAALMLLPVFFGINGIWSAITVAEIITLIITIAFLLKNKKRYGY